MRKFYKGQPLDFSHGQLRTYRYRNCRCVLCKAASAAHTRKYVRLRSEAQKKSRRTTCQINNAKRHAKVRALLKELKAKPCADCNQSFPPYVMHFDHRNPADKKYNVAKMLNNGLDTVRAEIAKCDLVCANCHAIRSHVKNQYVTSYPDRKVIR
jgi:hypothetical protein